MTDTPIIVKRHIVIVGGGAAGFFAAINAAELGRERARATGGMAPQVTLLEGTRRPLTKVSISGGGRCNVTHNCFDPAVLVQYYPRGARELRGPFSKFQPRDTVAWFAKRGVTLKAEADGRMFPTTDDSATIVQCLSQAARDAGVDVRLGAIVRTVTATQSIVGGTSQPAFHLSLRGDEVIRADRLLLATGSMPVGYELARSLGHDIVPLVPSLFTFTIGDPRLTDLGGVSFPAARVSLIGDFKDKLSQRGPLLITHWGLSGPAVLKLSAFAARELHACRYQAALEVAFLPERKSDELFADLWAYKSAHPKRTLFAQTPLDVPKRYWQRLLEVHAISSEAIWADATKKLLQTLSAELTKAVFHITAKGEFKEEFVTAGGIPLAEVDFRSMQSRRQSGLYFAGEILDIDGVTGGFNFQNAWTTAYIAAQNLIAD